MRRAQDLEVTDESAGRNTDEENDDAAGMNGRRIGGAGDERTPVDGELLFDGGKPGFIERDAVVIGELAGDIDCDGVAREWILLAGYGGLRRDAQNEGEREKRREQTAVRADSHRE